ATDAAVGVGAAVVAEARPLEDGVVRARPGHRGHAHGQARRGRCAAAKEQQRERHPHARKSTTIVLRVNRQALAALLVLLGTDARAGDGTLEWRTLESPHFVVSYYEPNEDIARRVAVVAERAHRVLVPILRHEPDEKTQIVLTDDTDSSNGFATVLPYNHIGLFATAPDALSDLNDHDDWLYGLVAHEYTHILHLDTMGWIPRLYNRIAGKVWSPNNIQPRWFVEGLAVEEESERSAGGRNRNAIFDMYLRIAVLEGRELDLDAVSSGPLLWPHGNAAY